jgi:hypothetical protein
MMFIVHCLGCACGVSLTQSTFSRTPSIFCPKIVGTKNVDRWKTRPNEVLYSQGVPVGRRSSPSKRQLKSQGLSKNNEIASISIVMGDFGPFPASFNKWRRWILHSMLFEEPMVLQW